MYYNILHGFEFRQRMSELKKDFDDAEYWGWVNFIRASILAGVVYPDQIVQEAIAISGAHIENEFHFLIKEGVNEHWFQAPCGRLSVRGPLV